MATVKAGKSRSNQDRLARDLADTADRTPAAPRVPVGGLDLSSITRKPQIPLDIAEMVGDDYETVQMIPVFTSRNYRRFTLGNREIKSSLIDRLVEGLKQHGFIASRPVIVNRDWYVIDGQHRILACEALGIPVSFTVDMSASNAEIIALNTKVNKWSPENFLYHYAHIIGNPHYQALEQFSREFQMTPKQAINVMQGSNDAASNTAFIEGEWIYPTDDCEARKLAGGIRDIKGLGFPAVLTLYGVQALRRAIATPGFSVKEYVRKVMNRALSPDFHYVSHATVRDALRQIEDIWNYRVRDENRITFKA